MSKLSRRELREKAFEMIFEKTFKSDTPIAEILDRYKEDTDGVIDDYLNDLLTGVETCMEELDRHIEKASISWQKSRISRVNISILRLAIYEIVYIDDIPVKVSINEAIELAKKYAGADDPAFINGVLGAVAASLIET